MRGIRGVAAGLVWSGGCVLWGSVVFDQFGLRTARFWGCGMHLDNLGIRPILEMGSIHASKS